MFKSLFHGWLVRFDEFFFSSYFHEQMGRVTFFPVKLLLVSELQIFEYCLHCKRILRSQTNEQKWHRPYNADEVKAGFLN